MLGELIATVGTHSDYVLMGFVLWIQGDDLRENIKRQLDIEFSQENGKY